MPKYRPAARLAAILSLLFAGLILSACTSNIPNRNPAGEVFPSVSGRSLDDQSVALPADLNGTPALILIGYTQEAQFDIDRWILGVLQANIDIQLLEVPTLPGLAAKLAGGWIDDGMRSGIPEEDWSVVVTLYGDAAEPVAAFTGTENGRLARVLVLDSAGKVAWFDDKGYSASKVLQIAALRSDLGGPDTEN